MTAATAENRLTSKCSCITEIQLMILVAVGLLQDKYTHNQQFTDSTLYHDVAIAAVMQTESLVRTYTGVFSQCMHKCRSICMLEATKSDLLHQ